MFRIASWSAHKAQIRAAFGHLTIVHEDNERRFWFEIGDKPRVQHFIDVSNGLSVCSGLLEIRAATTPDVAERDRLRELLERLTYTRTEPQRQALLAQLRGEIHEIRKLAEF